MTKPSQAEIIQCASLKDSIIRLCNEADSNSIVISALLNAIIDYGRRVDMKPCDLVYMVIEGTCLLTSDDPVSLLVHLLKGHASDDRHKGH
jgi:hypothetical protein